MSIRNAQKGSTIRIEDDFGYILSTCHEVFLTGIRTLSYTHIEYFTLFVGDVGMEYYNFEI